MVQFRENQFYKDTDATKKINESHIFHEPVLFRYTFLLKLKLLKTFYNDDFALYQIIEDDSVINKIPFCKVDYNIYSQSNENYFCLQSAPLGELGRLLNKANIDGMIDTWSMFKDKIQGDYAIEGLRYLIKGYFRFGSSGAPYLRYDKKYNSFKVNAIQSEASPIQMTINGKRDGNLQYINAIASPLKNIEIDLKKIIN